MGNEEGQGGRSAAWGVAAGVFCACAIATWQVAIGPKSTFPIWPTYVFADLAALALYMCFATVSGWWPTARSVRRSSTGMLGPPAADQDLGTNNAASIPSASASRVISTAAAPASLPASPVAIRLKPELDAATNRLRLGVLNRGELGRFRVQVIDAHNQDGGWVGPRSWPVPWLEDNSVSSKEIPKFGKPLLDFAHFAFLTLREDLEGTKWLRGDHWVFPSLPEPVKFRYSAVRAWPDLRKQYIVITLRVIRDEPEGHIDIEFKIGTDGAEPYCLELLEKPASGTPLPTDPRQLREPAVNGRLRQPAEAKSGSVPTSEPTPTRTDRWRHTNDGAKVPSLMRPSTTSVERASRGRQRLGRQPWLAVPVIVVIVTMPLFITKSPSTPQRSENPPGSVTSAPSDRAAVAYGKPPSVSKSSPNPSQELATSNRAPIVVGVYSGRKYNLQYPAMAADGAHIWAASIASDSLEEIDAKTGVLVRTLSEGPYDFDSIDKITDDGTHVWIANLDSHLITEINASDGSWIRNIQAVDDSRSTGGILLHGSHLWISNEFVSQQDSVSEVDINSGGTVRTLSGAPYSFQSPGAFTTDGQHVWVVNWPSTTVAGFITEFDAATGRFIRKITGNDYDLSSPANILYADGQIFVANQSGDSVAEFSANGGTLLRVLSGGNYTFSEPGEMAFDGTHLWVVNSGDRTLGSITEINVRTGTVIRTLSGQSYHLKNPGSISIVDNRIWIANGGWGNELGWLTELQVG